MYKINKAVFPVAGMGSRFLPATKANPKEMLPIVDKPLIQYAVEEAVAAGITQLIFVTSSSKRAIEDHFDSNYELEQRLLERGQHKLHALVQSVLPKGVSCVYIRQPEALGLGHAVLCARQVVGLEPFAVVLADDLIDSNKACLQQMMELYEQHQASILAVQTIPKSETQRYGIVDFQQEWLGMNRITGIVEKPKPEEAPSNKAVVGRYILESAIFSSLANTTVGAGGEIQLTDAIADLLHQQPVFAYEFQGKRYDCGSKLGYLQATVEFAIQHPEVGAEFKQYLAEYLSSEQDSLCS